VPRRAARSLMVSNACPALHIHGSYMDVARLLDQSARLTCCVRSDACDCTANEALLGIDVYLDGVVGGDNACRVRGGAPQGHGARPHDDRVRRLRRVHDVHRQRGAPRGADLCGKQRLSFVAHADGILIALK